MMNGRKSLFFLCATLVSFALTSVAAWGQTEKVLHTFLPGTGDGLNPVGLVFDNQGNLYGTTVWGGVVRSVFECGCGVVFQMSPNSDGTWTEKVVRSFAIDDNGAHPQWPLVVDSQGKIYGAAASGGLNMDGVVFELTPGADGNWTESVLHTFDGTDGAQPLGIARSNGGQIFGTTYSGGADDLRGGIRTWGWRYW